MFHEKSPNYKDVFILHFCRISSPLWLKLYLHCQAIKTPVKYTIVNIMGTDGLARPGAAMCWNQNIPVSTPRLISLLLMLLLRLLASLLLILFSSNKRTCLSSIDNIMDADGLPTQWSILSFQYQEVIMKIHIYIYLAIISWCFKMNPAQQEMIILCLTCTSIISTDYTCKCISF